MVDYAGFNSEFKSVLSFPIIPEDSGFCAMNYIPKNLSFLKTFFKIKFCLFLQYI